MTNTYNVFKVKMKSPELDFCDGDTDLIAFGANGRIVTRQPEECIQTFARDILEHRRETLIEKLREDADKSPITKQSPIDLKFAWDLPYYSSQRLVETPDEGICTVFEFSRRLNENERNVFLQYLHSIYDLLRESPEYEFWKDIKSNP
ncbi:MAG: hypothetical protein Q8R00_04030 [Candidatus Nanoarchaeia archaeon]|nr:hypothetical protein [Candidatus Nanoarchaeia archaeon]